MMHRFGRKSWTKWRNALLSCLILGQFAAAQQSNDKSGDRLALSAAEQSWLKAHPVIRFAPYANYAPLQYIEDGVHKGLAADYTEIIERRLGITFQHVQTDTWQEILGGARSQSIDLIALAADTEDRRRYLAFSDPYLRLPAVLIARRNVAELTLENIGDKSVGVAGGYAVQEYLQRNYPSIRLMVVDNTREGLRDVSFGSLDVFVSDLAVATHVMEMEGINNLHVVGETGYLYEMGFACRSDWPMFRTMINRVLNEIPEEQHDRMFRRWVHVTLPEPPPPLVTAEEMQLYAGFVLLLVVAMTTWSLSLKRQVRLATGKLVELNDELEQRVRSRTSELVRANSQLTELSHLHEAVLDSAAYCVVSTDCQGIIQTYNAAAERMFGYKAEEVVGKKTPLIFHSEDEFRQRHAELCELLGEDIEPGFAFFVALCSVSAAQREREWIFRDSEGRDFPALLSVAGLYDENGEITGVVGIAADITVRKQAETEIRNARDQAEAANRAKSQFLANMSHELRTPLTSILGFADLAEEDVREHNTMPNVRDLQRIQRAGRQLHALIDDVLDLSKIEAGEMEVFAESVYLPDLADEVVSLVQAEVEQSGNTLKVELGDDVGEALIDLRMTRQILLNLLSNAAKFTEDGEVTLRISMDAEQVVLEVEDTGIGMTAEQCDSVFESFQQGDPTTTRKYGGTGLGLSIAQSFCNMMGGSISVSSELDVGTTFTVCLPLRSEAPTG
jgi:PAS domain S-box-containing protein